MRNLNCCKQAWEDGQPLFLKMVTILRKSMVIRTMYGYVYMFDKRAMQRGIAGRTCLNLASCSWRSKPCTIISSIIVSTPAIAAAFSERHRHGAGLRAATPPVQALTKTGGKEKSKRP
ncbi:hypothetical protein ROHU_021592 [Labeo rohita]|uniref:Uncharacterized protein n=1 Tax=Labeo rohita TaxID=84645 RepID=A0A498N972_LABRO|nr:hypothetical protein ROHU_021592 [Labeo rohita]